MTGGGFGFDKSTQKNNSYSESSPLTAKQMQPYWNRLDKNTGGQLSDFAQTGTAKTDYSGVANPDQYFSTDLSYHPVSADLSYKPVSADVTYHGVSNDQLRNLGGLGATRQLDLERTWQNTLDQNNADAGLTLAQRQRSNQLSTQDYTQQRDAVDKETEAAITQAALEQAQADQAGRQSQAGFDAGQWTQELEARQNAADFAAQQAQADQSARVQSSQQEQNLASFLQSEAGKQYEAAAQNAGLKRDDLLALAQIFFQGKGQKSTSTSAGRSDAFGFNANANVGVS